MCICKYSSKVFFIILICTQWCPYAIFYSFLNPPSCFSCIMCIVITCKSTYQFEMMIILETFLVAIDGKLFTNLCTCVWTKLPKLGKSLTYGHSLDSPLSLVGVSFLVEKKECIIEKTNTCFVLCLLFFKWMSAFLKVLLKGFFIIY